VRLPDAARWVEGLAGLGVLALAARRDVIRLVTHREISRADIDRAVAAFAARHAARHETSDAA